MGFKEEEQQLPAQYNQTEWPAMKEKIAHQFETQTCETWLRRFEESDICVMPVLDMNDTIHHVNSKSREMFFQSEDGCWEPTPSPKLILGDKKMAYRLDENRYKHHPAVGEHTQSILREYGFQEKQIADWEAQKIIKIPCRSKL
jgi:alpha-methylacyl-CoA racemase